MISFTSIWAVVLRHARLWKQDLNLVLAGFYWPVLDVLIWGFLGAWIAQSNITEFKNYETVALLGILLWQVIGRGCNLIGFTFGEELWSHNIVNLFSLPLRLTEWMIGITLFSFIMIVTTCSFCMCFIFLLYNVSITYFVSTFLLFLIPLFFSTMWVGFMCLSVFVLLGKRGIELGFVLGWFLLPFSGAYYPIEILPTWGQKFSSFIPMSYLFKGMRAYVMYEQNPMSYIVKGMVLGILYATCAMLLFVYCFKRSKQKGLARLTD